MRDYVRGLLSDVKLAIQTIKAVNIESKRRNHSQLV